jgi:hypothetical protein
MLNLPRPQQPRNAVRLGDVSPQAAFQILELQNDDVQDVLLKVPNDGRVSGKVVVADGKSLPVADHNLPIPFQLMLRPLGPLQPAPVVTAVSLDDGKFEVGSNLEGKYRFNLTPLKDNYYVSEVQLDGVRVTDGILAISKNQKSDLIITLSPGGEVQGSVVDKEGRPVSQAQGILFPDPLPEVIPFYLEIEADASGGFNARGIPPGNYKIYFWDGVEREQFFDRDRLRQTHAWRHRFTWTRAHESRLQYQSSFHDAGLKKVPDPSDPIFYPGVLMPLRSISMALMSLAWRVSSFFASVSQRQYSLRCV